MTKTNLRIRLDPDLADFIHVYAQENRTTISNVMTQFLLALKRQTEGDSMELILANPDFHNAILEAQSRIRDGTAEWYTFEEVFGDYRKLPGSGNGNLVTIVFG